MEPFILLSLTKSKNRVGILSSKNPLKNIRPIFTRLHVDSHIIRIFTKKKDMVAKYKRHLLVEFKNSIQSSEQKSAKWTEFFLIFPTLSPRYLTASRPGSLSADWCSTSSAHRCSTGCRS